jgi:hypothetical protein
MQTGNIEAAAKGYVWRAAAANIIFEIEQGFMLNCVTSSSWFPLMFVSNPNNFVVVAIQTG